ncbi:Frataxin-like, mitochondrial [Papilio machaon]|uniref:ferroxidase n=1 Tax=Papilio machaon TaxID=76193 RepID=A0A194QR44_PAPMA|nr:Frataxin-like, mitochondrial [Papilio machaon]
MIRNFFRTSRWLVLRQINNFTPIVLNQCVPLNNCKTSSCLPNRTFLRNSSNSSQTSELVDPVVYEEICNETLESLCDYFEEIVDQSSNLKGADVTYSDGVLTVALGPEYGTYVINRQSPNKQIWLSSPVSGPKRYDLILKDGGYWMYKHDGVTLHKLLQDEISKIVVTKVDFGSCSHAFI